jgi:phage-related protein
LFAIIFPFLNVVEWVFRHIKSIVRQNDFQSHGTLLGHVSHSIPSIIPNMAQGWKREVNRNFGKMRHLIID